MTPDTPREQLIRLRNENALLRLLRDIERSKRDDEDEIRRLEAENQELRKF